LASSTKVGGRLFIWAMYLGFTRLPLTAGGGWRWVISRSQSFRSRVLTLTDQFAWALKTPA
jgi:hypothetical protein